MIGGIRKRTEFVATLPMVGSLMHARARRAFVANRTRNMFYGVHSTWDQAASAAEAFGQVGYDNVESARLYENRTRMDPHDYPSLYWLSRSLHEGMKGVLDVGGAIGIKFIAFREPLQQFSDLLWRVQDVPAVVANGRELARQRNDDARLQFTDRFEEGEGLDILFASGVLQYLPRTLGELLGVYKRLPKRIVINTAPIHPEREFFTVNSLGTAFCPYRVQTQASLMSGLSRLGYRLRESWINPDKPMLIPFRSEYCLRHYSGYCLDLAS